MAGTTNNSNILFRLSGATQGLYTFEQNPMSYNLMSPKQSHTVFNTLVGENIYQRALLDNEVRVMKWEEASYALYSGLKNYAGRDQFGTIVSSYFWDGTVNEFQGVLVDVIDVYGKPIVTKDNKWTIELQFKPTSAFDKEYRVI